MVDIIIYKERNLVDKLSTSNPDCIQGTILDNFYIHFLIKHSLLLLSTCILNLCLIEHYIHRSYTFPSKNCHFDKNRISGHRYSANSTLCIKHHILHNDHCSTDNHMVSRLPRIQLFLTPGVSLL